MELGDGQEATVPSLLRCLVEVRSRERHMTPFSSGESGCRGELQHGIFESVVASGGRDLGPVGVTERERVVVCGL